MFWRIGSNSLNSISGLLASNFNSFTNLQLNKIFLRLKIKSLENSSLGQVISVFLFFYYLLLLMIISFYKTLFCRVSDLQFFKKWDSFITLHYLFWYKIIYLVDNLICFTLGLQESLGFTNNAWRLVFASHSTNSSG